MIAILLATLLLSACAESSPSTWSQGNEPVATTAAVTAAPATVPETKPVSAKDELNEEERLVFETLLMGLENPVTTKSGAKGVTFDSPSSVRLVKLSEQMMLVSGEAGYYILELEADNEYGASLRKKYNMMIWEEMKGVIVESGVNDRPDDNIKADISKINKALKEHWVELGLD